MAACGHQQGKKYPIRSNKFQCDNNVTIESMNYRQQTIRTSGNSSLVIIALLMWPDAAGSPGERRLVMRLGKSFLTETEPVEWEAREQYEGDIERRHWATLGGLRLH